MSCVDEADVGVMDGAAVGGVALHAANANEIVANAAT
jgi:hypothetical protein